MDAANRRDGPSETPTFLIPRSPRQDTALVTFSLLSVAVIIISVWYFFVFLFNLFNAFLHHVNRNPYRRPNSRLSSTPCLLYLHLSSNSICLEMHRCNTLLWGNARLDMIPCPLYTSENVLNPAAEPSVAYGMAVGVTFTLGIYRLWT